MKNQRRRKHDSPLQHIPRLLSLLVVMIFCLSLFTEVDDAYSQRARGRHIGYGISVGPHLPSRPDLLDAMGMDWVKIYDTSQIPDYPNQNVLYRVDMRGYPENIEAWERGLYELATQLDSFGVKAVEIGNEPNLVIEWGGNYPNAEQFTDALCRGYRAFKAVAPHIVVVVGGIAPAIATDANAVRDLDYIQEMFNHGAGNCFDAFAYHPYGFDQPPEMDPNRVEWTFRRTERVYRLLWYNGHRDKQIWITEFGWIRDPAEDGLDCDGDPTFQDFNWVKFPAELQAAYTARAFTFAEANWPWTGPMFLWNLNWNLYPGEYEPPCSHLRWYGILNGNGSPLPVYYALLHVEKRAPVVYRPKVGAVVNTLTRTFEAGCANIEELGSFTVLNTGFPGDMTVAIEPANGPGRPFVWTDVDRAESGDEVHVMVDASGIEPGLHLVAINLRMIGGRTQTDVVRGWLLVHYPSSPQCITQYNNDQ